MYLYYFNKNNGTNNEIYVSKIIKIDKNNQYGYSNIIKVFLDPKGDIKKDFVNSSVIEGYVYHRNFWLKEYDIITAMSIIKSYFDNDKNFGINQLKLNPFLKRS